MKNLKVATPALWTAAVVLALGLASCKQNPFPKDGVISGDRLNQRAVLPPYGIDVLDVMDFAEGVKGEFNVKTWVPDGKEPQVTFYNLPQGAEFNKAESKLVWTPGYDAANSPNDLASRIRTYSAQIVVRSPEDPIASVQRTITLQVKDSPRKFQVEYLNVPTQGFFYLDEGKEFTGKFKIVSEDFPQGPFQLAMTGFPLGTTITQTAAGSNEYTVKYTPSSTDAKAVDGAKTCYIASSTTNVWGDYPCVESVGKVTAITPNAYQTESDVKWKIVDTRINPKVTAPTTVTQGADIGFAVTGVDLNGEGAPEITLRSALPNYGKFSMTADKKEGNNWQGPPVTTVQINWKDIPSSKFGSSEDLEFRICAANTPTKWDATTGKYLYLKSLCVQAVVKVEFTATEHKAPIIVRDSSPFGTFIRVKVGTTSQPYVVTVTDAEDVKNKVNVRFEGLNTGEAALTLNNTSKLTEMTIKPDLNKVGMRQFSLVATSAYGMMSREVFFLDALPANWKDAVLFGRGDAEAKKLQTLVTNADYADAELEVNERTFASRSIMYIGTGALGSSRVSGLEVGSQSVKHVVVSSPRAGEAVAAELAQEFKTLGFNVRGRVASTGMVVNPVSGGALTQPAKKDTVTLAGTLTAESKMPATFRLATNSKCKTILELGKPGEIGDPVGLVCERANKGKLIVLGFELGDLVTASADAGLVSKWIEEMFK